MTHFTKRRALMLTMAAAPVASLMFPARADTLPKKDPSDRGTAWQARLAALEASFGGRLGLAAVNTASGRELLHRANERFPFCSTFKVMAASAILARSTRGDTALLQRRVSYTKSSLVAYSPITGPHVDDGMTVAELCAAALQYSDNTAVNLLMNILGGPQAVTAYARSIGDTDFRLDRWETELNSAIPGDQRDTTTPHAMAMSLHRLVLGDALPPPQREQLKTWLLGNTTGAARIRAGVPAGWQVGDKTGTGSYGCANDIGVIWPSAGAPIVLALYLTHPDKEARTRNDILASATKIVVEEFA